MGVSSRDGEQSGWKLYSPWCFVGAMEREPLWCSQKYFDFSNVSWHHNDLCESGVLWLFFQNPLLFFMGRYLNGWAPELCKHIDFCVMHVLHAHVLTFKGIQQSSYLLDCCSWIPELLDCCFQSSVKSPWLISDPYIHPSIAHSYFKNHEI